ncbi:glycosyltransferase family A protein [Pseudomonas sp. RIT-PI-S]|uniref:glycosyltransferase family 2 protein n=1 Tax=Pseudomonas sp. RIT-PI-S TaxID=3035295 RepID=UPI0021DA80BA|nr:glycosyltransferase family A protein [Pseudomonas sp. RIT-PI-S]
MQDHICSESPLVSVIIASYNHRPYVEASIRSVLAQTYQPVELIVVDDGSTDGSVELLQELVAECGFSLTFQPNMGLSRTLNAAIARSAGSLIVPFGSDDIMFPHRLATQVAYLQDKPEVGICSANIENIGPDGQILPEKEQRKRNLPFRRLDFADLFFDRKPGPTAATLMLRREAFERVGGFDPNIRLEDIYIQLAIARAGYFVDVLGEPLSQYRKHPGNTYKKHRFMYQNVLTTFAAFKEQDGYDEVCMGYRNAMFLKSANRDKQLAREILREIPLRYWNRKTLRGLCRLALPR